MCIEILRLLKQDTQVVYYSTKHAYSALWDIGIIAAGCYRKPRLQCVSKFSGDELLPNASVGNQAVVMKLFFLTA